ncbi:MAG TPA: transglutaminase N-terminal domain-containing protein, partial [Solirubrobacteraceae bacterium]|nr:transglutaminase N-terminal domain-containing protein [Solirubrobacteraceae bacterium]
MSTRYRITHRTDYHYEQPVSASYGQLHIVPRDLAYQRCLEAEVTVAPAPELHRERIDYFGNRVGYFALHEQHEQLTVTATSVVEVDQRLLEVSLFGAQPWEAVRDAASSGAPGVEFDIAQYVLDSPLVATAEQYRRYAEACFPP